MIELKSGETLDRVDFTLLRGGVIAGRVVDEFGEPLSGLEVSARRVQTISGRRQLVPFGPQGLTNDIGEFRIFGLEPGQYAVLALWRRMGWADPASPDRNGYPLTYFPGTTNEAEAQRFTVAAGQTISDLAMALSPIKTARVEGTVVDVDGRPMGNSYLEVLQSSANTNFMAGAGAARRHVHICEPGAGRLRFPHAANAGAPERRAAEADRRQRGHQGPADSRAAARNPQRPHRRRSVAAAAERHAVLVDRNAR
jgi:hypothetical protein